MIGYFANTLLYNIITSEGDKEIPVLPSYILDGLAWLKKEIIMSFNLGEG